MYSSSLRLTEKMMIPNYDEIVRECREISAKKNKDYAGDEDPFKNFRLCEEMGVCSTEQGILTRILDKQARLINVMNKGSNEVANETVEDTVQDLINYHIILLSYLRSYSRNAPGGIMLG